MRRAFVQIQCPTNPAFAFRGDTRSCPGPPLETHLVAPLDGESILLLECALLGPLRAYALLGLGEIDGGGQVRHPVVVLSSVVACGSVWDLSFLRPCLNFQQPSITSKRSVTNGSPTRVCRPRPLRSPAPLLLSCPFAFCGPCGFLHFLPPSVRSRSLCFEEPMVHVEAAARLVSPPSSRQGSKSKALLTLLTATQEEPRNSAGWKSSPLSRHSRHSRRPSPSIDVHPQGSKSKPAGGWRSSPSSPLASRHTRQFQFARSSRLAEQRKAEGALGAVDQGVRAYGWRRAALSWAELVPDAEAGAPTANSVETSG